jgi:ABC-type phosphate/phosphonate transport system permease subunit
VPDDAAAGRVHDEGAGVAALGAAACPLTHCRIAVSRLSVKASKLRQIYGFQGKAVMTLRRYVMMPLSHRRILHPDYLLAAIKLLHTAIWAVLAGSILALPVAAFTRNSRWLRCRELT